LLAVLVILALAIGVSATQQSLEVEQHVSAVHSAINEAESNLAAFDADVNAEEMEWAKLQEEMEFDSPLSDSALAFLEMGEETENDEEMELEMDDEMEMDDEENENFLEADSDSEVEADAESETESDSDSEVEAESSTDSDSEADLDSTTLIVSEFPASHEQDADPIMTESMEQEALFDEFGLLEAEAESEAEAFADSEADADADADADAEADSESESETESESELEAEAEVGEDGVVHTPCGKKIIWEKRTEETPVEQA